MMKFVVLQNLNSVYKILPLRTKSSIMYTIQYDHDSSAFAYFVFFFLNIENTVESNQNTVENNQNN